MNKRLTSRTLADFTSKLANKWNLITQSNTSKQLRGDETTVDFLRDLVAIPTISGNYEANHDALEYIDAYLRGLGFIIKRYTWNNVESLVASTQDTKTPTVCLLGHIDVVPAPAELFQLREEDGNYYGRGVLDMKLGVAAYLGAVKRLSDNLGAYNFSIMITTDEEVSGFDGAAKLAEEGYRPKVIVLPDGGSDWNMERFAKGIWHMTVEVAGASAHGSRPWEGENAIDKLTVILGEIKDLFPRNMKAETSTVNIGMIQGGEAINQIPAAASASIDMRFANMAEQTAIAQKVQAILANYSGVTMVTEIESDPIENDANDPYLAIYKACTEEVIGRPVEWMVSNAGNDARFFAKYGIPYATAYPTGAHHHGNGECIPIEVPEQMETVVVNFLERVAKTNKNEPSDS